MFCGECGTQNPDTNQFCKNCGKPLGRRQPAAQPAAPPASHTAAVPVSLQLPATGPVMTPVPGAAPIRTRNWPGIVSLIPGVLSWVILTGIFAIGAILLGIISLVWFRRATGKIGISAIIGIVLGIAAIAMTIMLA